MDGAATRRFIIYSSSYKPNHKGLACQFKATKFNNRFVINLSSLSFKWNS